MKRIVLALAAVLFACSISIASSWYDAGGGGTVNAVIHWLNGSGVAVPMSASNPLPVSVSGASGTPYPYTAMGGAQYNQAATTSTALTVPTGALYARVCAVAGQMNFVDSTNGTPTTGSTPTVGTPLAAGACIWEQGATLLSNFKLINAVASTGTWTAAYFQ